MNNNLVERIIEIEKKANEIVEAAEKNDDFKTDINEKKEQIKSKYDKMMLDATNACTQREKELAKNKLDEFSKEIADKKLMLEKQKDENSEKWIKSIFDEVIG